MTDRGLTDGFLRNERCECSFDVVSAIEIWRCIILYHENGVVTARARGTTLLACEGASDNSITRKLLLNGLLDDLPTCRGNETLMHLSVIHVIVVEIVANSWSSILTPESYARLRQR